MSQARHALVVDENDRNKIRYCERCGARIEGPGSWGHDSDCPNKKK